MDIPLGIANGRVGSTLRAEALARGATVGMAAIMLLRSALKPNSAAVEATTS